MQTRLLAFTLFLTAFIVYNSNGREIGSYDSQPTKFTAMALALHHELTLDATVERLPPLSQRPGFAIDREGHYRTAYPVFPAIVAGGLAIALSAVQVIDLRAPAASGLVATLTASLLTALAVALAFLLARRRLSSTASLALAAGLGFGTNLWAVTSRTLWQSETAVAALMGALLCLSVPAEPLRPRRLWWASLLLGLAGAARPQLAPAIGVLALSIALRRGQRVDALALLPLAVISAAVVGVNMLWFGHPLGAVPRLEALHPNVHGVTGSFGNPLAGAAGLLVSPSRGLLVFSPIVAVAAGAWPSLRDEGWRNDLRWIAAAALAQFAFYASYIVWWGGHTYGPRYAIDILPLLVPLAAAGLPWWVANRWRRSFVAAALAWSVGVAATGAFVYPHEGWNSDPSDVDRNHERLWEWRDSQIIRCWKAGPSPQNFSLFEIEIPPRPQ